MSILFRDFREEAILNEVQNISMLQDIKGAVRTISALKPVTGKWDNSYFSPERVVDEARFELNYMLRTYLEYNNPIYKDFYKWVEVDVNDGKVSIKDISLEENTLGEFAELKNLTLSKETLQELSGVSYWAKKRSMSMYFGTRQLNGDYSVYVGNQFYDWYDETVYYYDEEEDFIEENQKWFCELYSASSYSEAVKTMSVDMDKIKKAVEEDIKSFEDFLNERIKDSSIDL